MPQGSRDLKELEGVSVIGVQQIDRVVEVVEETLNGHEVWLLSRKSLPSLDLPKVYVSNCAFNLTSPISFRYKDLLLFMSELALGNFALVGLLLYSFCTDVL